MNPSRQSLLSIPGAIIIAGALIAIAVIWTSKPVAVKQNQQVSPATPNQLSTTAIPPVTAADHILGNPNASVKIVEYSDPSCPFCKTFNPVMIQIMNTYGNDGKVAWVYRHFPLDKADQDGNVLHPNAGHEAQGFECAASLGGNAKFWAFEKEWYTAFPDDGAGRSVQSDTAQLLQIAKDNGIDAQSFTDCLTGGESKSKIDREYADGITAGISGTPTSFILTPSGNILPLEGALPYSTVKGTVDTLLSGSN